VLSEAKKIHQGLKDLLKTKEPFAKETDFQRKNLRRRYLSLLLVYPYAKESKDAETHLWMQTSYSFIAVYKQRISALDRVVQNGPRQQQQQQNQSRNVPHSPVEYRKLLQRFRQFLAEEEKFWTQLVVRFSRSFALDDAQPALIALGILSTGTDGKVIPDSEGSPDNGRNHFQFPAESTVDVSPTSDAERESRMAILSKALICLGDIARYREQYNESGGRPKAGHDDMPGPARRGRNRGSLDSIPRARNYEKARHCYEQARLLVPNEGNPSHQLAILANYQKDPFASLVHYYRALCVRQPYDTASENMGTVMTKAFEQWNRKDNNKMDPADATIPKVRIDNLKEKVVVIHALWRIGFEKTDVVARKLMKSTNDEFFDLVSYRHMPEDLISSFIVLSQSALWKHLMIQDPPGSRKKGSSDSAQTILSASVIEARIFEYILALHTSLLEVGIDQLKEPPPVDAAENDLAQRITAVFRRTLPALRIASKWLLANYDYVMRDLASDVSSTGPILSTFWKAYADFLRALSRAFPVDRLPSMTGALDEDVEMRGFLPLRDMMGGNSGSRLPAGQHHPNVLQLMRIGDLFNDAMAIVKQENSPLAVYGNRFMLKGVEALPPLTEGAGSFPNKHILDSIRDNRMIRSDTEDDELTELTSKTDDEVVRDAFRFLDTSDREEASVGDDDEEEDEVLYPRAPVSPIMAAMPSPQRSPVTPVRPMLSPVAISPAKGRSPFNTPMISHVAPTTAQDLLNDVMGLNRSAGSQLSRSTKLNSGPSPSAAFLFGSEPRNSIWSASQDEQSLKF
ncbi:hypothetical protein C8J56DRAFT_745711, partial [Mycena floridula]